MTNLEAVIAILAAHREARKWTDEAVAHDLLGQLGLDAAGKAANATPAVKPGITEAEVVAHEVAAKEAVDKAQAWRHALNTQAQEEDKVRAAAAAEQAKAAEAARQAALKAIPPAPAGVPQPLPAGLPVHDVETRHYTDGTSATGVPPLPAQSPEQQAAEARWKAAEAARLGALGPPTVRQPAEPVPPHA